MSKNLFTFAWFSMKSITKSIWFVIPIIVCGGKSVSTDSKYWRVIKSCQFFDLYGFFVRQKKFITQEPQIVFRITTCTSYVSKSIKVSSSNFGLIEEIMGYRRSSHFVIFGTKRISRNWGITNCGTLFSIKIQIGSKKFLKSYKKVSKQIRVW